MSRTPPVLPSAPDRVLHPTLTRPPESARHPADHQGTPHASTAPEATRLDRRLHRSYWMFHAVRQWLRRHITPAGALLFWATLTAGAFTDVSQTMSHQLFGVLLCLLLVSLVWVRKPKRRLALERTLPRRVTVGVAFPLRLHVRNLTPRPLPAMDLWEGVSDPRPSLHEFSRLAEPGEEHRNWFDRRYRFYRWTWHCERKTRARLDPIPLPPLPASAKTDVVVPVTALRRGRLTFAGTEVARSDPFGLFRRLGVVRQQPDSVVVLPRPFRLPPIPLPGQSRRLQAGGIAMAGSVGESEEFVSVRDYRPGDPVRRIHWAGWARTRQPVVKEFQEEFFVRHALLLDTFGGGPEADAFEDAVRLAASFVSTVDQRDSLLDLMFIGDQAYVFTAGRGLAHAEQMLEILAGVELDPQGRLDDLETLVLRHLHRLSGCILVLLDFDPARRRLRERLEAHRVPTLTFVVGRGRPPDHSPLPPNVHWLPAGSVEATLSRIA